MDFIIILFFIFQIGIRFTTSELVILPENFTKFLIDSPDEVRKYFFDNRIVTVDTISQIPTPPSNCLTTGFENPSLLIYCLILALIWLGIVATGLFFYFRTIFQRLTKIPITSRDIELQLIQKDGFDPNRKIIMGK